MEGAHPKVMQRLFETNLEQTTGYGTDPHTAEAKRLIREAVGLPEAEVYLLVGGTQTNATVIGSLLRGSEGVVAADTGHINVHEAGAVEATGHKVLTIPGVEGKIPAEALDRYLSDFFNDETWDHMVIPALVYVSNPTEYGTIYSKSELEAIAAVCRKHSLRLFLDGARLGYGLAAEGNDLTLKDIARICDIFYIGGTKVGALFGEAVVIREKGLIPHFFTSIKRHGALLAKGRLLGLQFETLFTDGLYLECGRNAVDKAMKLKAAFAAHGYTPIIDSPTNQQFFRLPNEVVDRLREKATFEYWGPRGETCSTVRFVTSWATTDEAVASLIVNLPFYGQVDKSQKRATSGPGKPALAR